MIISAFPGTGKSHLYKANKSSRKIYDSDSSKFSWLESGERNPNFVTDYCDYIEKIQNKKGNHLQLISSHKEVRDELRRRNFKYTLIYPSRELKNEYIERYIKRGSHEAFVKLMTDKWDEMIDSCEQDEKAIQIVLKSNEYISDIMDWSVFTKIDEKQIINHH